MVRVLSSSSLWRCLCYLLGQTCSDIGGLLAWRHQRVLCFSSSLGVAFCSRTAADGACCVAGPLAVHSSDSIAMIAEHSRGTFTLPCGCKVQPLFTNAEGLRASTRQYCAHGVVYGELLLQPIACVEDLVVQASRVSPYGSYLRQVLSAHGTGVMNSVFVTSRRHRRHEFDHYRSLCGA